jgi:hypothetical protein
MGMAAAQGGSMGRRFAVTGVAIALVALAVGVVRPALGSSGNGQKHRTIRVVSIIAGAGHHDEAEVGGDLDAPADGLGMHRVVAGGKAHVGGLAPSRVEKRWRTSGATDGSGIIDARSSLRRSTGRHRIVLWIRALAFESQEESWELKSSGEEKVRPGRKLVSRYPMARSTTPLRSG